MLHDRAEARAQSLRMLIQPSSPSRASCPSVSMLGVGGTLIPSQSSSGDIKEAGRGPLPGTAGGIRLAKPSLLPFALWHGSSAYWASQNQIASGPRRCFLEGEDFDRDVWCGFAVNMFRGHRWLVPVCGRGHVNPRGQLGLLLCTVVITSPA